MLRVHLVCRVILVLLFAHCVFGQEAAKETAKKAEAKLDPKAKKTVSDAAGFVEDLKGLSLDLAMTLNVQMQGMKQEMPLDYSLAVERPNKYAMVLKSGFMGGTVVSDGSKLSTYSPMFKKYTVADAPSDLSFLSDPTSLMAMSAAAPGVMLLGSLFGEKPEENLFEGVTEGQYIGREKVEGAECDHVRFKQEQFDWDMWVQDGKEPLIRKIVLDMAKSVGGAEKAAGAGEMGEMMKNMKMVVTMRLNNWKLNPKFPADSFSFTAPAGVEKADSFLPDKAEEHSLVGQPAPLFKLPLLAGGELDLAALNGKKIVILDFWATWCGPCVRALPILADVAQAYKDKDVVLYAVNQKEDKETIEEFLKKKKLTFNVPLDSKAEVGDKYGVEGIPQTVIIDKKGKVQVVHVGFRPDLKAKLSTELDAIIAGKDLKSSSPEEGDPAKRKAKAGTKERD